MDGPTDDELRFEVVDPVSAEAIAALTVYFAELDARFVGGFDPGDTLVADAPSMRAPGGAFVVAFAAERVVACTSMRSVVAHEFRAGRHGFERVAR